MENFEIVEQKSKPLAKQFIIVSCVSLLLMGGVFYLPQFEAIRILTAFLLFIPLVYCFYLTIALFKLGVDPLPVKAFLAGNVIIVGGSLFDIIATLVHTPDLAQEGNPIARALLDGGVSLGIVMAHAALAQTLAIVLCGLLWGTFLKHRNTILALGAKTSPKSRWEFVKAATGGANLTWRQYFFPVKISELPTAYLFYFYLPILMFTEGVYRFCIGLKWFRIIEIRNDIIWMLVIVFLNLAIYYAWLYFSSENHRQSE